MAFRVKISYIGIKAKLFIMKKWFFWSGVGFFVWYFLECAQRNLGDFWKKRPANFNSIWIEWNSYNSWTLFQIVWWRTMIFKLKCSLGGVCNGSLGLKSFSILLRSDNYWRQKFDDLFPKIQLLQKKINNPCAMTIILQPLKLETRNNTQCTGWSFNPLKNSFGYWKWKKLG